MKTIFHLDMDQFFMAVEILHNPSLRGKCAAVGGSHSGRGIVSTASYEARKYGVRSGMSSLDAIKLCPQIIFVRPSFEKYSDISLRVFKLLRGYTDRVEQVSIDEGYADFTDQLPRPAHYHPDAARAIETLALAIKNEIKTREGITATIGVGANRIVAKMASGMNKPDGFTYLPPWKVAAVFRDLPVNDLIGVGPSTTASLGKIGVQTIGQLAVFPEEILRQRYGKWGPDLLARARGEGSDLVQTPDELPAEKSISNETTFSQELRQEHQILAKLHDQCERVARRARAAEMTGRTVSLRLRYSSFETLSHAKTLRRYIQHETDLYTVAERLFHDVYKTGEPVRLIGVGISELLPIHKLTQMDLFMAPPTANKVPKVFDAIKDRFGDEIIGYGAALISGQGKLRSGNRVTSLFNPFHAPKSTEAA